MSSKKLNKFNPIEFNKVSIEDSFFAPRIELIRNVTMEHSYNQLVQTGRIEALKLNWKSGMPNRPHKFWDSDVAKWIESAAYLLMTEENENLKNTMNEIVDLIVNAQQPDGYLNTYFTQVDPNKKWTNLRDDHELYCAGHLMEAAVAHYNATGKKNFLDAMCKNADLIDSIFGKEKGKKHGYPGHEEIELALYKLYKATDNEKYLNLSKYFIDQRGEIPDYFVEEAEARGEEIKGLDSIFTEEYKKIAGIPPDPRYWQNHLPVREQDEIVGHAVRAMYLYSGMVDVAIETGDKELLDASYNLWKDTTTRKMYITGGVGSSRRNEGITYPYHLPNDTAYAETCASIAIVFWAHRMLQIDCESVFADIMEKALYNNISAALSLSGDKFFYENPLEIKPERRTYSRFDWFGCCCCPNNITRLFATIGQYAYSLYENDTENGKGIAIHLFIQGNAEFEINKKKVIISQESNYPWDGSVKIKVNPEISDDDGLKFEIRVRIPNWCKNYSHSIDDTHNGYKESVETKEENGYLLIEKYWKPGDELLLNFEMPVERMYSHPKVESNFARVALQRGPIIFCLEETDNGQDLNNIFLMKNEKMDIFNDESLGTALILETSAIKHSSVRWGDTLYATKQKVPNAKRVRITAIPYCVWNNRTPGEMQVWIRED